MLDGCIDRAFYEPKTDRGEGSKLKDFNKLLSQGKNIVSTHSLFAMIDESTLKYLKEYNYTLILDEVFNVVEEIKITKSDREILLRDKVDVSEDGKLTWIDKITKAYYLNIKMQLKKEIVTYMIIALCYGLSQSLS